MTKKNGNGIRITNKELWENLEEVKDILHKIKEDSIKLNGEVITIKSKQKLHEIMIFGSYGGIVLVLGFLFQRMINGGI